MESFFLANELQDLKDWSKTEVFQYTLP